MSFDPRRVNWGLAGTRTTGVTPHERVVRWPEMQWVRKAPAGENLGLGTNLRYPLPPVDEAIFPLYLNGGSVFKMTVAQYLEYIGILLAPQRIAYEAQYCRKGKFKLIVGTIAITENTLVMCESDGGGVDGDIIPQSDLEAVIFQATGVIGANTPTDIGEDLGAIASATLYDESAATTTALTVVTAAPGAGEIRLVGTKQIELGDALAANDIVSVYGTEEEHLSRHTVGTSFTAGALRVDADNYDLVEVELV